MCGLKCPNETRIAEPACGQNCHKQTRIAGTVCGQNFNNQTRIAGTVCGQNCHNETRIDGTVCGQNCKMRTDDSQALVKTRWEYQIRTLESDNEKCILRDVISHSGVCIFTVSPKRYLH
jgi:hypothetical protein